MAKVKQAAEPHDPRLTGKQRRRIRRKRERAIECTSTDLYNSGKKFAFSTALAMLNKLAPPAPGAEKGGG